jgi:kynurenine formamidase
MQHPHAIHNWGVFGADDEIGTLNYLTAEAVRRGVAAAKHGQVHQLSLPLNLPTDRHHGRPELTKVAFRRNEELMGFVANDDYVVLALQGSTQWDSLIHCGVRESGVDGVFYNGVDVDAVDESGFAHRNGIDKVAARGIAGRGVLLDIARFITGSTSSPLPNDFLITEDVILDCRAAQYVVAQPGDIVCLRTGWSEQYLHGDDETRARLFEPPPGKRAFSSPGIVPELADLVQREQWSALAADNPAVEATPMQLGAASAHVTIQRNLGVHFGELFYFGGLAPAAADAQQWDFLFTSAPLWIPGGMGSPACALAIL